MAIKRIFCILLSVFICAAGVYTYATSTELIKPRQLKQGDIDESGVVDVMDLSLLQQHLLGVLLLNARMQKTAANIAEPFDKMTKDDIEELRKIIFSRE